MQLVPEKLHSSQVILPWMTNMPGIDTLIGVPNTSSNTGSTSMEGRVEGEWDASTFKWKGCAKPQTGEVKLLSLKTKFLNIESFCTKSNRFIHSAYLKETDSH